MSQIETALNAAHLHYVSKNGPGSVRCISSLALISFLEKYLLLAVLGILEVKIAVLRVLECFLEISEEIRLPLIGVYSWRYRGELINSFVFCQPITVVYCGQLTNESAQFL